MVQEERQSPTKGRRMRRFFESLFPIGKVYRISHLKHVKVNREEHQRCRGQDEKVENRVIPVVFLSPKTVQSSPDPKQNAGEKESQQARDSQSEIKRIESDQNQRADADIDEHGELRVLFKVNGIEDDTQNAKGPNGSEDNPPPWEAIHRFIKGHQGVRGIGSHDEKKDIIMVQNPANLLRFSWF